MQTKQTAALNRAIAVSGGITKFSRMLGLSSHMVAYHWRKTQVPAAHCPDIELLTGTRCEALRPDVNWGVLRVPAKAV